MTPSITWLARLQRDEHVELNVEGPAGEVLRGAAGRSRAHSPLSISTSTHTGPVQRIALHHACGPVSRNTALMTGSTNAARWSSQVLNAPTLGVAAGAMAKAARFTAFMAFSR